MKYLLDSDFCISCLRRRPWALKALGGVAVDAVAVSALTVGELLLGTRLSSFPEAERAKVEAFLEPIEVLAFDREEASLWADLEASLRRPGSRIGTEDAMIAATALAHGLTLVTGNRRHFERVKGLKRVDWRDR